MAKMRQPEENRSPEELLPPKLREFDPTRWPSRPEWLRARHSALYRLGVRRLPSVQAMARRPFEKAQESKGEMPDTGPDSAARRDGDGEDG